MMSSTKVARIDIKFANIDLLTEQKITNNDQIYSNIKEIGILIYPELVHFSSIGPVGFY